MRFAQGEDPNDSVVAAVIRIVSTELGLAQDSHEFQRLVQNAAMLSCAFPAENELLDVTMRVSRVLQKRSKNFRR